MNSSDARIIGNVPLDVMISRADVILAGTVADAANNRGAGELSITVMQSYKGTAPAIVKATASRMFSSTEIQTLRSTTGLFMIDRSGFLLQRTGSLSLTDLFVPASLPLASTSNVDASFCIDWMRGLMRPGVTVLRDLAVAAAFCGGLKERSSTISQALAHSHDSDDRLISIMTRLPQGDASAVVDLQVWPALSDEADAVRVENIAFSLFSYANPEVKGSHALRALAQQARSDRIREAAAKVLCYLHSDETWTDLVALLESNDQNVQRIAIEGLHQTVDAGEREEPGAFERQLSVGGVLLKRNVHKRPGVPSDMRVLGASWPDAKVIAFWRQYVRDNP
jgi:hypothetical protein